MTWKTHDTPYIRDNFEKSMPGTREVEISTTHQKHFLAGKSGKRKIGSRVNRSAWLPLFEMLELSHFILRKPFLVPIIDCSLNFFLFIFVFLALSQPLLQAISAKCRLLIFPNCFHS